MMFVIMMFVMCYYQGEELDGMSIHHNESDVRVPEFVAVEVEEK